ncbi:MAG: hypothetical protein DI556_07425 [Rhodovulum sulfidophilum]|uniref:Uncharacterized protein n=1 Tax=Rhodovulum sulfidophilum TaxID=35806 RepID=A0A2W5NCZ0_RHOSU|nr:MAG: hypothetical protein DI556_07425 [Rhodovulum sulfidophilum]
MRVSEDLAGFIEGPILMTIGTRDAANRPMISRGTGGRAWDDRAGVTVAISDWLWPECVANLRDNGMIAITFVRPDTYEAFQVKGRAEPRPPTADERLRAADYIRRATVMLRGLEIPPALIATWLTDRDIVMADLTVDRVFEQTPGPRAGRVVA